MPDSNLSQMQDTEDDKTAGTDLDKGDAANPENRTVSAVESATSPPVSKSAAVKIPSTPVKSELFSSAFLNRSASVIDLTADFSSPDRKLSKSGPEVIDLSTPIKPPSIVASTGSSKLVPRFKMPKFLDEDSNYNRAPIDTDDEASQVSPSDRPNPPLKDMAAIAKLPLRLWRTRQDKVRMVIAIVHKLEESRRNRFLDLVTALEEQELWEQMSIAMFALRDGKSAARGVDIDTFKTLTDIMRIFEIYVDIYNHKLNKVMAPGDIAKLDRPTSRSKWPKFVHLCHNISNRFESEDEEDDEDDDIVPPSQRRSHRAHL